MSEDLEFIFIFLAVMILPLALTTGVVLLVSALIFRKNQDKHRRTLAVGLSHVVAGFTQGLPNARTRVRGGNIGP